MMKRQDHTLEETPVTEVFSHGKRQDPFDKPENTTIFVQRLSSDVTEDELRSFFEGFGDISYVKIRSVRIRSEKISGLVCFVTRDAAKMAIEQMQGYSIGRFRVRLSWAPHFGVLHSYQSKWKAT
jgi:RNA recognition motif-containing protein